MAVPSRICPHCRQRDSISVLPDRSHSFRSNRSPALSSPATIQPAFVRCFRQVQTGRCGAGKYLLAERSCDNGNLPIYAGLLRQVFSNLLLNATDAMPEGGRLHARASTAREWSGRQRHGLRVTFADSGCGISAENLHKIFKPFFTTKDHGGNGLGLSLVKDVVHKHGGTLRIRSSTTPGRSGSIFAIFLPEA